MTCTNKCAACRCAFAPPGNAVSSPVGPHIQTHQPHHPRHVQGAPLPRLEMPPSPLCRLISRHTNPSSNPLQVRLCPAWKFVVSRCRASYPGGPNGVCAGFFGRGGAV